MAVPATLRKKITEENELRILFLNDLGFQYGAGVAQLRQIQSFLLRGHKVMGICWRRGLESEIPFFPHDADGVWCGIRELTDLNVSEGCSKEEIISALVREVRTWQPDVVIVGNLHGANWPLEVFLSLRDLDLLVVGYMHDCYLITGRCCYPGDCRKFLDGCNDTCPTCIEYPVLSRSEIHDAWALRRTLFSGPQGVSLAANSKWSLNLARKAMPGLRHGEVVYLGLDEQLFKPIDRPLARRLLGIPENQFVILSGAINVGDPRKGWHIFNEVVSSLGKEAYFLMFGENSLKLRSVHGVGLLRDYRKMPILYSAADIFVATSLEEAFGQTILEASSCCLPVVAFSVGGLPEIARNGENAFLIDKVSAKGLVDAIRFFMKNPERCEAVGRYGRGMVEEQFSLKRQGERWMEYLREAVSI